MSLPANNSFVTGVVPLQKLVKFKSRDITIVNTQMILCQGYNIFIIRYYMRPSNMYFPFSFISQKSKCEEKYNI